MRTSLQARDAASDVFAGQHERLAQRQSQYIAPEMAQAAEISMTDGDVMHAEDAEGACHLRYARTMKKIPISTMGRDSHCPMLMV